MNLEQSSEYKVYKISYKESFGCLKAIQISITNNLETPLFEKGRPDRAPVVDELIDTRKTVNKIRVRIFQEKTAYFITGVQLCHQADIKDKSDVLGNIDLHDYGEWQEHMMDEGD